jgi:hypothetical protein
MASLVRLAPLLSRRPLGQHSPANRRATAMCLRTAARSAISEATRSTLPATTAASFIAMQYASLPTAHHFQGGDVPGATVKLCAAALSTATRMFSE